MQGPQLNSLTPEKDSHCISAQRGGGEGKFNGRRAQESLETHTDMYKRITL